MPTNLMRTGTWAWSSVYALLLYICKEDYAISCLDLYAFKKISDCYRKPGTKIPLKKINNLVLSCIQTLQ